MVNYTLEVSHHDNILEIVFDKPKVDATCSASSRELSEVFAALKGGCERRVAIFSTTGGSVFSVGWDLKAAAGARIY